MLINEADIIIIGAGAAGMMAAWAASSTGKGIRVVILEKMPRPGRKIMITGKGRCNFTNVKEWSEFSRHIHPKANFLRSSFYNLNPERLMQLFSDYGMASVVERGDRAFPESHLSSVVVDTLVKMCRSRGVELLCNCPVISIEKEGEMFTVKTANSNWQCRKLIVTTGGLSYPGTGSTGDGHVWAKTAGHQLAPCLPSLTALVPEAYKLDTSSKDELKGHINRSEAASEWGQSLIGLSLENVGVSLFIDGNKAEEEFGDIDFTDGGLEGPVGFKLSRKAVNAIANGSKVSVSIDLKPAVSMEELDKRIRALWQEIVNDRRSEGKPYKTRYGVLLGKLLPSQLCEPFRKSNPGKDHSDLAKMLKNWKLNLAGYVGYERAVVTAGGVKCEEIVPKTLESKLVGGLYFAGEVLDLDADTGGYNLHIAFSTGCLAGQSASLSL